MDFYHFFRQKKEEEPTAHDALHCVVLSLGLWPRAANYSRHMSGPAWLGLVYTQHRPSSDLCTRPEFESDLQTRPSIKKRKRKRKETKRKENSGKFRKITVAFRSNTVADSDPVPTLQQTRYCSKHTH